MLTDLTPATLDEVRDVLTRGRTARSEVDSHAGEDGEVREEHGAV